MPDRNVQTPTQMSVLLSFLLIGHMQCVSQQETKREGKKNRELK